MTPSDYPRARIHLLWDEQLSPRIPRALRELGFSTAHVGSPDGEVPARGSEDGMIVAHAQKANQVIVTSNHDMMLICSEANQRFVWVDPRGRQYSRAEQVLLVFQQIEQWEALLASGSSTCVRALRTKCAAIEASEASRLAHQRMRALQRRRRAKQKPSKPPGSVKNIELSGPA